MPTVRRARLYVRRHAKRTVLLFLLFTILMTISLLGLALHTASSAAIKELRGSIGGYFMLQTGSDGSEKTGDALLEQVKTLDNISRWNVWIPITCTRRGWSWSLAPIMGPGP